jgi:hypothetical protein
MGKEVKQRAKRMKGWTHPELAQPKPKRRPTKGDAQAQRDKRAAALRDSRYRSRWGIDKDGFPTMKTKAKEKERKILPAG